MGASWGTPGPTRLPRFLRRRETEQRRVDAFLAVIRATAPAGTLLEIEPPTAALPMTLVTLLVPARGER